jgi:hypothetical protein
MTPHGDRFCPPSWMVKGLVVDGVPYTARR